MMRLSAGNPFAGGQLRSDVSRRCCLGRRGVNRSSVAAARPPVGIALPI